MAVPNNKTPENSSLNAQQLGLNSEVVIKPADRKWWTSFDDPQLNTLIQKALQNSPDLEQALAQVRAAESRAGETTSSSKPQVNLSATGERQKLSGTYTIPPPYGGHTYWISQGAANFNWDLDFWGRQKSLILSAENQVKATEFDHAAAYLAASGAVTRAYLGLYRTHMILDITQQQLIARQQQVNITKSLFKAGLDDKQSLHQIEALLPQAEAAVTTAENNRELAIHQLAALVGQGPKIYAAIRSPHPELVAALPIPKTLPLNLLSRRPDVLAARARIEANKAAANAARAAFYPNISLTALLGIQTLGLDNIFKSDSITYGGGAALDLPLFDSGKLRAAYQGSIANEEAAIATYNQTVLNAVQQTADELSNIQSLKTQHQQWQKSLAAKKAELSLAKRNYSAGLISRLPVLDARYSWLETKLSIINIEVNLAISRVNLLLATGGSFDPKRLTISVNPEHINE